MERLRRAAGHVLDRAGARLKVDLRYVAKGGVWLAAGQAASTLAGLAVTLALANLLTAEAYGSYKYVLSLYGTIAVFSLSGMPTAVTRATARGHDGTFREAVRTSLRWGLGMTALGVGIGAYYLYQGNGTLGWAMVASGLVAPLIQSLALYHPFVNGKKDFHVSSTFSFSYSFFPPLALIATAFLAPNPLALVLAFLGGQLVVHAAHYFWTLRRYRPSGDVDPASIGYGKHLSLMNIAGGISFQLDKLLVWHALGAAPLAVYSIATAAPQQLRYANKILATMALPRFSARGAADLQASMGRKLALLSALSVSLVVAYWVAAPFLYATFFPQYMEAVPYSRMFSLVMLFFPAGLLQEALSSQMQKRELYLVQTVLPIVKIGLLIVLLPTFGLTGVIAAVLGAETLRLIAVTRFFYAMR